MKHMNNRIIILLIILISNSAIYAQSSKSSLMPKWLSEVPISNSPSFTYNVFTIEASTIASARRQLAGEASFYAERAYNVSGVSVELTNVKQTYNNQGLTNNTDISLRDSTIIESEKVSISLKILAEYQKGNKVYFLCTVTAPGAKNVIFDDVQITNKYGADALVRSLVPSWGQFYKGSKVKGGIIIGAEVLGVGAIVTSYSMKGSYEKLILEDPRHATDYSMMADTWTNVAYGSIAFTAAVYIYNLIDALVAPGASHLKIKKRNKGFSMAPVATNDYTGMALVYKF